MKFKFSFLSWQSPINVQSQPADRLLVCSLGSCDNVSEQSVMWTSNLCERRKDSGLFCSGQMCGRLLSYIKKKNRDTQTAESIVSIQVIGQQISTWSQTHSPMQPCTHTHTLTDLQARVNWYVGANGWELMEINDPVKVGWLLPQPNRRAAFLKAAIFRNTT